MSYSGIKYALGNTFTDEALVAHYDFNRTGVNTSLVGGVYYSYMGNLAGAGFSGFIGQATGSSSANAKLAATGSSSFLAANTSGNFTKASVGISGLSDLNFNDCSAVFSFHTTGQIYDGVLFGSLKPQVDTYQGIEYVSSKGFDFGLTSRGHLFFHTFSDRGDSINVATSIEMAPKNIVSFAVGNGEVEICRFDYLNGQIQSEVFPIQTDFIKNSESVFLGAAPNYWRTSSGQKCFSGCIDQFLLFSGKQNSQTLFEIGSGIVGEYSFSSGAVSSFQRITGYSESPLTESYTGITGYINVITGYQQIPSGDPFLSYTSTTTGVSSIQEGSRYFVSGENGHWREEVGYLADSNFGTYSPTGVNANSVLGLQGDSAYKPDYLISSIWNQNYFNYPLYYSSGVTGLLTRTTGYSREQLYETVYVTGENSSGIVLSGNSSAYKKDYLYLLR